MQPGELLRHADACCRRRVLAVMRCDGGAAFPVDAYVIGRRSSARPPSDDLIHGPSLWNHGYGFLEHALHPGYGLSGKSVAPAGPDGDAPTRNAGDDRMRARAGILSSVFQRGLHQLPVLSEQLLV